MIQKKEIVIKFSNGEDILYRLEIPPTAKIAFTTSKSAVTLILKRYLGVVDTDNPIPLPEDFLSKIYDNIAENQISASDGKLLIEYRVESISGNKENTLPVTNTFVNTIDLDSNTYIAHRIFDESTSLRVVEEVEISNFK